MFQIKKKKIQAYIAEKTSSGALSPFDELLSDYLSGKMKERILTIGVEKVEIHIDWLTEFQCIDVQGVYNHCFLDLQIEPTEFSIGYDPDEPDEYANYPLESKEQLYSAIKQTLGL